MIVRSVLRGVAAWYRGTATSGDDAPPSPVVLVGLSYRRHWTADVARALVGFWTRHWQWIIATAIAATGLIAALAR